MMKHLKRTGREKKNYSYQKNVENSPHRHCKPGKRKSVIITLHLSSTSKGKRKKREKQNNKSK